MLPATCISLKSVDSTNSFARKNLHEFDPSRMTVISAEEQTHGRGRNTNTWVSPPAENLYVSFVFPYQNSTFLLSQMAALSVFETLSNFGVQGRIKWPNDLISDKGKISGILIEHVQEEIGWAIVGIGINVQMKESPKELTRKASSIYLETAHNVSVNLVLAKLLESLQRLLQRDAETIQNEWHAKVSWMIGKRFPMSIDGTVQDTLIEGISPEGLLKCKTASGSKTISSAELF